MTAAALTPGAERQAQVIVVGAGPAGSATAYHLAQRRPRRPAAGEDGVPAREGLRRRADPPRGQAAGRHGHRHSTQAGWSSNKGLRIIGGGTRLELPWPDLASYPPLRPGPHPDGLRRAARPAGREGRRAAARAAPTSPARSSTSAPAASSASPPSRSTTGPQGRRRGRVPRAAGGRRRRQLAPGSRSPWACNARRPPDGRRRPHLLHAARARRRLAGVLAGAVGRQAGRRATCCPATAGSSAWATAPATSASASSTPPRPSATSTTRTCCSRWLANTPEEWGFRDENQTGPIRGAALPMGFNRKPHYTRGLLLVGDAGGMVNPFNGEGIAYAMESGRASPPRSSSRRSPAVRRPSGSTRLAGLPGGAEADVRRLLHARPGLREADRQPDGHAAGHQVRPARTDADEVHAEAAREPHRPARRRREGPDHQRPDQGAPAA